MESQWQKNIKLTETAAGRLNNLCRIITSKHMTPVDAKYSSDPSLNRRDENKPWMLKEEPEKNKGRIKWTSLTKHQQMPTQYKEKKHWQGTTKYNFVLTRHRRIGLADRRIGLAGKWIATCYRNIISYARVLGRP